MRAEGSGLIGKVLYVHHATDRERTDVQDLFLRADLADADIVVATEGTEIQGFAVLRHDGRRSNCLVLKEMSGHRGIGRQVLRHLLRHRPVRSLAADGTAGRYLKDMDFHEEPARGGSSCCAPMTAGAEHRYRRSRRTAESTRRSQRREP